MAEDQNNGDTLVLAISHRYGNRPPTGDTPGKLQWSMRGYPHRGNLGDPSLWLWILTQELHGRRDDHLAPIRPWPPMRVETDRGLTSLVQCCKATRAFFGGNLRIRCYTCFNSRRITGFYAYWSYRVFSDIDGWQCNQCRWWGNTCRNLVHPRCGLCWALNDPSDSE